MKVKVLAKADESMRLLLEETEPAYANALRRVLVSDVPKMAIEDVEFHLGPIRADDGKEYESVGPLFDEMIAHRLGLVPIPTDLALYNRREDCPTCHGEGCPNCTIIYSVNKRGPGVVTSAKFREQFKVDSVKAANDPTRMVMEFETDGSMTTKSALLASLDILGKRFSELATQATALA